MKLPASIKALFFVRLINSMGNFVFPFLTMLLTVKLGYSEARAGAFMSTAAFLAGLGILAGGKLGDSFGRRRIIVCLQLSAAVLMGACAFLGLVPAVPYLIAAAYVLLQASWPVFNALVADLVPGEGRKRAYALLYWGNNIGFSIGPLMAGYLFNTHASYMFIGNAASLAIVSMILIVTARAPVSQAMRSEENPPSRADCGDEAPEDCSLAASLLKRPLLILFAVVNLLLHFVYQQHLFGLPVFLNQVLGDQGPAAYGLVMTTNGLTVVILTGFISMVLIGRRASVNIAGAAFLYSLGFGMLALCGTVPAVLASTVVWTIGEIVAATNVQVFVASRTPSSHRGRMNAAISWFSGWGTTLAPMVAGLFIARYGSRSLWPFTAATAAAAGLLMLAIARFDLPGRRSAPVPADGRS